METSDRRVRALVAVIAAALAVMSVIGPVAAAKPQSLTLVSTTIFNPDGFNYGTFTASGDAVDNGVVCGAGSFVDTFLKIVGYQSGRAVQITVDKTYTCPNGTFFVKMQIHANFDGTERFTWVVKLWKDGENRIRLAAQDAAGNETRRVASAYLDVL